MVIHQGIAQDLDWIFQGSKRDRIGALHKVCVITEQQRSLQMVRREQIDSFSTREGVFELTDSHLFYAIVVRLGTKIFINKSLLISWEKIGSYPLFIRIGWEPGQV